MLRTLNKKMKMKQQKPIDFNIRKRRKKIETTMNI